MLTIYNSLSRQKELFRPILPGHVRLYVCGMTVYDHCHIGHARVMVVFDMIVRYLRSIDYQVTYVRNITDIDDKIIDRAGQNNESIAVLTARYIQAMHEDAMALGVSPPDSEPKATEHIPQIIAMIERLMDSGHAYQAENKDIYFDVSRFEDYGRLSGKRLEALRVGARVSVQEAKRDPLDFVLWKTAKPGDPCWDSPWGDGRPGWHIECSAMSTHCLAPHFDIHGGGQDLQFPHHENEIAQSVCATGDKFVNFWMHNGFVRINEEKMSKSLDNFFTVREVLKQYPGEVIRFFILSSHYRSPLNYTVTNLVDAQGALTRLYSAMRGVESDDKEARGEDSPFIAQFHQAMEDDFNTPKAIAILHDLAHTLNRCKKARRLVEAEHHARTLSYLGGILGLLQDQPAHFLQGQIADLAVPDIDALVAQRDQLRADRDFAGADAIRKQLEDMGILLEDRAIGETLWRRKLDHK